MDDQDALVLSAVDESDPPRRREWIDVAAEGVLFLPNVAKLLTRLLFDPRIPIRRKVPAAAAIGYVISPIDLIPDTFPGIGLLDDAIAFSVVVDNLITGADASLIVEHWDGSIDALDLATSFLRWGAALAPYRSRAH